LVVRAARTALSRRCDVIPLTAELVYPPWAILMQSERNQRPPADRCGPDRRIAISRRNRQRCMPLGNGRTTGQKLTA
jgi:hypothetical protein